MLSDYHVHTTFCDGKSSASEMAERALSLGFSYLGFSGHADAPAGKEWCMTPEGTEKYKKEIGRLKEIYRPLGLTILLGVEKDYISDEDTSDYDYCIGSVHYLTVGGEYVEIDVDSPEALSYVADTYFGGDFDALAEEYYSVIGRLGERVSFDIIGHFDLITKQAERANIKFTDRYFAAAKRAIDRLIPYGKPFEINTGAVTRGYRTAPYPARPLLEYIQECGGKIVITGDCHSCEHLGANRDKAILLAKECGFKKHSILTPCGFIELDL